MQAFRADPHGLRAIHYAEEWCFSEIFDGDDPFEARGCIAQARRVAELLRVGVTLADFDPAPPAGSAKATQGRRTVRKTVGAIH